MLNLSVDATNQSFDDNAKRFNKHVAVFISGGTKQKWKVTRVALGKLQQTVWTICHAILL